MPIVLTPIPVCNERLVHYYPTQGSHKRVKQSLEQPSPHSVTLRPSSGMLQLDGKEWRTPGLSPARTIPWSQGLCEAQREAVVLRRGGLVTEIRPLRLHDLPFAYRVAKQGINFDVQLGLTVGEDALRHAVLAGIGRMQTYVLRSSQGSLLGQLHYLTSQQHARLAYITPGLDSNDAKTRLWFDILDGLTVMAGRHGVVTLIAEIGINTQAFTVLRRANFATYARQDLWMRQPEPTVEEPSIQVAPVGSQHTNGWMSLYNSLVPGLIKHVEPPLGTADKQYVISDGHGVAGIVVMYGGPSADLIEIYMAPQTEATPQAIVNAALSTVQAEKRIVYCRARDYMGCPASALSGAGFEYVTTQAALYRHTAARVRHQAYDVTEKVEGGIPIPTSIVDSPGAVEP